MRPLWQKCTLTGHNLPSVRECHFSPFDEVLQDTGDVSGCLVCLIHHQHQSMLHRMHLQYTQVTNSVQPEGCVQQCTSHDNTYCHSSFNSEHSQKHRLRQTTRTKEHRHIRTYILYTHCNRWMTHTHTHTHTHICLHRNRAHNDRQTDGHAYTPEESPHTQSVHPVQTIEGSVSAQWCPYRGIGCGEFVAKSRCFKAWICIIHYTLDDVHTYVYTVSEGQSVLWCGGHAHLWSCRYSLGRFRSCRKRSAILFFPTPWAEEGEDRG